MRFFAVSSCALALLLLAGCGPKSLIGAGATAVTTASQERGFTRAVGDTAIRAEINALWFKRRIDILHNVGLSVVEGRVLLTGKLATPELRLEAVRLAWEADGVREVINEIQVTEEGGIGSYAHDTWISAQLKTKLLIDKGVQSINYSIDTVGRVVYLMGIAQSQDELDRVTEHARNLRYVRQVVSHVRLKDDPRRKES